MGAGASNFELVKAGGGRKTENGPHMKMPKKLSEEQRHLIIEHVVTITTEARSRGSKDNRVHIEREELVNALANDPKVGLDRESALGLLCKIYGDAHTTQYDCQRVECKLAQLGVADDAETLEDGRLFVRYPNGATVQALLNGLRIRNYESGEVAFERLDGSELLIYPDGATSEIQTNGLKIDRYQDGTQLFEVGPSQSIKWVTKTPDGTTVLSFHDGIKVQLAADGTCVCRNPEGARMQYSPMDRTYNIDIPNGLRTQISEQTLDVIHLLRDGCKIMLDAQGNQFVEYPDGARGQRKLGEPYVEVDSFGDPKPLLTDEEISKLEALVIQVLHDGTVIKRMSNGRIVFCST